MAPVVQMPNTELLADLKAGAFHDPNAGQSGFDPQDQPAAGLPGPDDPRWHLSVILGSMLGDRTLSQAQQANQQPLVTSGQQDVQQTPPEFRSPEQDQTAQQQTPKFGLDELRARASQNDQPLTTNQTDSGVPGVTGTGGAGGDAIISDANKYLGIKYVYGGTNPNTGLDCSGFVQRVFADMGVNLPRVTYDQVKAGVAVNDQSALQPGDLIFMVGDGNRTNGHVGIYVGNGVMVDAPHTGTVVRYDSVPWNRVTAMRRVA